jgi:RNA-directed DNA polymerase
VIRYADDMVILHRDQETLEAVRVQADTWLAHVGVRLKPSKTQLTHTLLPHNGPGGFAFLGFEVRQYPVGTHRSGTNGAGQRLGFKTLIKPSKTAQTRHLRKTGEMIRQHRGNSQEQLINTLGPVITGWSRYYAHVVSKAIFTKMYTRVHHQLRRWAAWRHPRKGYHWRMQRYWQRHEGVWVFGKTRILPRHPQTPIQRHVKVAGTRSPFDGDWAYWGRRLRTYAGLATRIEKLLGGWAGASSPRDY